MVANSPDQAVSGGAVAVLPLQFQGLQQGRVFTVAWETTDPLSGAIVMGLGNVQPEEKGSGGDCASSSAVPVIVLEGT